MIVDKIKIILLYLATSLVFILKQKCRAWNHKC